MNFKKDERGFVFIEFVIALPLLILLLYALGTLTFQTAKIAREQVADYVLETEAQYVIDRITQEARAAYDVEITHKFTNLEQIILYFNANTLKSPVGDAYGRRRYTPYSPQGGYFCVYAQRTTGNEITSPITGQNDYGKTFVSKMKFKIKNKVLYITLEMQSLVTKQKVKFDTAVYMPAYEGTDYG